MRELVISDPGAQDGYRRNGTEYSLRIAEGAYGISVGVTGKDWEDHLSYTLNRDEAERVIKFLCESYGLSASTQEFRRYETVITGARI